jgi:hypothetical protein
MAEDVSVVDEKYYRSVLLPEHWERFIESLRGAIDPRTSWRAESELRAKQEEALWRLAMANPDDYLVGKDDEVTRKS